MTGPVFNENRPPFVSVGVPTFNRPKTLRKALELLLAQTWTDLEIIVSDNRSTDPEVDRVLDEFVERDHRIKVFRQRENIGAVANFLFVLEQAAGEFFMWAADDDEWAPDFIETLVREIDGVGLAMTDFETVFHAKSEVVQVRMPVLSPQKPVLDNALSFLHNMQPSLIYGLHRRRLLNECIIRRNFDLWDCAVVFKILLRNGIRTVSSFKYRAGVHTPNYEIKTVSRGKLSLRSAAVEMLIETWRCDRLGILAKLRLSGSILWTVWTLRRHLQPLLERQWKEQQASRRTHA